VRFFFFARWSGEGLTMPDGPVYRLDLGALPDSVPGLIRLRGFLKSALRGYRRRAVDVRELTRRVAPAAPGSDGKPPGGPEAG
jgi:hypothetical protein